MNSQPILSQVKNQIIRIKQTLQILLSQASYDVVSRSYRSVCTALMYFLRIFDTRLDEQDRLWISDCFVMVHCLVESTQFQKYAHRFCLFKMVIKRYHLVSCLRVQHATTENILIRTQKNQQSQQFKQHQLEQITEKQMTFLQTPTINQSILDLTKNQINFHNSQCVCCSEVFIKNFSIKNLNPKFRHIVGLTAKKGFDPSVLEKYVSAVCNAGGGVIIIGAEPAQGFLKASGVRFKSQKQASEKEAEVVRVLSSIAPPCEYKVRKVRVHTNFIVQSSTGEQFMRYLMRIQIFPWDLNKISYIELSVKGYASVYEAYKLDVGEQPIKIAEQKQTISDHLYLYMHQWYREQKKIINSHQGILCVKPHEEYSKIFKKQYAFQGSTTIEEYGQKQQSLKDQPNFKYQNTCLIAVAGKKYEREIINFVKNLKNNKIVIESSKPFKNSFKNCSRIIQVLSFQIQFATLKKLLAQYQKQGVIKANLKVLQVDRNKLSTYNENKIQTKFSEHFNHCYRTQTTEVQGKNQNIKTIMYMITNQFSQSIFIYMICDELGIRPYFVKESSANYQLQKH